MPGNAWFKDQAFFWLITQPIDLIFFLFLINVRTPSLWHVHVYPKVTSFFKLYKVSVLRVTIIIAHIPKPAALFIFFLNLSRKGESRMFFPGRICMLDTKAMEKPPGLL